MSLFANIRLKGRLAAFNAPYASVDRYSYDVITPSAARGAIDAVVWYPEMRWLVHAIYVVKPGHRLRYGTTEMTAVAGPQLPCIKVGTGLPNSTVRYASVLADVEYIVTVSPLMLKRSKHQPIAYTEMLKRRVRKGQYARKPYLGLRQFTAHPSLAEEPFDAVPDSKSFGIMLYDKAYAYKGDHNRQVPVFFEAVMENGRIETDPEKVLTPEQRQEVLRCSYKR